MWCEPTNLHYGFYFCIVNIKCINRNNKQKSTYPDLDSGRKPILYSLEIQIATFCSLPTLLEEDIETSTYIEVQYLQSDNDNDFEVYLEY